MKPKKISTKRKTQTGFRSYFAKIGTRRQKAVTADPVADDFEHDSPHVGVGRALTVILVLHVIAIAAIYFGTRWNEISKKDNAAANAIINDVENVTGKVDSSSANKQQHAVKVATPASFHSNGAEPTLKAPIIIPEEGDKPNEPKKPRLIRPKRNPNLATRPLARPAATARPAVKARAEVTQYVIKKGDNLYRISRRLHVPQKQIEQLNPNLHPKRLRIGQKINVPKH